LIPWYERSPEEVAERLAEIGVDYYLRIPNENNHPILKKLGVEPLLDSHFTLLESSRDGAIRLYAFTPSQP
jgi:hypothetical protein